MVNRASTQAQETTKHVNALSLHPLYTWLQLLAKESSMATVKEKIDEGVNPPGVILR